MKRPAFGYALLLSALAMALASVLAHETTSNWIAGRQQAHLTQASQAQTLSHIRMALLAFAVSQGANSLSMAGNLPCPSLMPGGAPQTTCLNSNGGFLPEISVIKTNYTRNTVPMLWNTLQLGHDKNWAYVVSPQVLQANPLGWSQWVDFSKPGMTVLVGQTHHTDVIAVVAEKLTQISQNAWAASGNHVLLDKPTLQKAMADYQRLLIHNTVLRWLKDSGQAKPTATENLQPGLNGRLQAVDSQCQCHCTATRCQCGCTAAADWRNARQVDIPVQSDASSTQTIFGPAQLKSRWPVSRYSPTPLPNSGCQPVDSFTCPLAQPGKFCDCNFSWPVGALGES